MTAVAVEPITESTEEVKPFDFDSEFQTKIAALALRDDEFMRRTSHILKPEYFENAGEAKLVEIALKHFQKYNCVPDKASLVKAIKDAVISKAISKEIAPLVVEARKHIIEADISNRSFVEDHVVNFARQQGMAGAIIKSLELLRRGNFTKIEELIAEATSIGINEDGSGYDYYAKVADRTVLRIEKETGVLPPQGITTGDPKLDGVLYHRGWGRKELTSIMGGAKAGKTTALINFARAASWAGHNVLYVTLEVGANIIADRLDASVSGTYMKELGSKAASVAEAVKKISEKAGKIIFQEYASGTCTPNMLRQCIQRYKNPGRNPDGSMRPPIKFDLIVVDYADIMAPNYRTQDAIENSKSVYVDLRAIAFEENVAVLTATQTNREGFKSAVAKAEHVSEDFNKVRTVDLMISINKTEEEAARGEARLYFAASRNQESGFTIVIKQNLAMMRFIEEVIRIE
ncbi:DnaB-like helicase C-terminal domain-containing protein [Acinetobacter baumannii]|nr:DNA helicase [Acinetobacter baumannii]